MSSKLDHRIIEIDRKGARFHRRLFYCLYVSGVFDLGIAFDLGIVFDLGIAFDPMVVATPLTLS